MKICVVTRSYPAAGDLYKYPFVHRRVRAYADAGHEVRVFRPDRAAAAAASHTFDEVECLTGDAAALNGFVADWKPDVIAAHGLTETMWDVLEPAAARVPVRAWLHGSEIPGFMRRKARVAPEHERPEALQQLQVRCAFWERMLDEFPPNLGLVFVSRTSIDLAAEDWGTRVDCLPHWVIPNPVDTDLFAYRAKDADDRFRVLLVRPFDSPTYANDLAVEAIRKLVERDAPRRLRFTIIGDGPLFDEIVEPLRTVPSVTISRRFLHQEEIAAEHARSGIFLVPTRLDTQGVSRDEAMASGLVPVTNAIPAVREFADDDCAALAPPDDADALAESVWEMIEDPELFLRRSSAAARTIADHRSNAVIIPLELDVLKSAAGA